MECAICMELLTSKADIVGENTRTTNVALLKMKTRGVQNLAFINSENPNDISLLVCGHFYHTLCLQNWLTAETGSDTCPSCRKALMLSKIIQIDYSNPEPVPLPLPIPNVQTNNNNNTDIVLDDDEDDEPTPADLQDLKQVHDTLISDYITLRDSYLTDSINLELISSAIGESEKEIAANTVDKMVLQNSLRGLASEQGSSSSSSSAYSSMRGQSSTSTRQPQIRNWSSSHDMNYPPHHFSTPSPSREIHIFVDGIQPEVSEADIYNYFSIYGRVVYTKLEASYPNPGVQTSHCFITLDTETAVEEALKTLNPIINGKHFNVHKYDPFKHQSTSRLLQQQINKQSFPFGPPPNAHSSSSNSYGYSSSWNPPPPLFLGGYNNTNSIPQNTPSTSSSSSASSWPSWNSVPNFSHNTGYVLGTGASTSETSTGPQFHVFGLRPGNPSFLNPKPPTTTTGNFPPQFSDSNTVGIFGSVNAPCTTSQSSSSSTVRTSVNNNNQHGDGQRISDEERKSMSEQFRLIPY